MNEIIKVNFDTQTVSARELHERLGINTRFNDWFPRMCEYGFSEGTDFCSFLSESSGGRPAVNHQLTIDMAKQICMIQRSEKGKLYRQYFIDLEKAWNTPEQIMARALQIANRTIDEYKTKCLSLEKKMLNIKKKLLSDLLIMLN